MPRGNIRIDVGSLIGLGVWPNPPITARCGPAIHSRTLDRSRPLARLWAYAQTSRRRIWWAAGLSAANKAVDVAPPLLIGMALSTVTSQEDSLIANWFGVEDPRSQLLLLAAITFAVWSFESLFEYLLSVAWRSIAQDIQHGLRVDAYTHMQELELGFFEDERTGDLLAVVNDDVNQLERFLDHGANDIIQLLTTVVVVGAAFWVIAPEVAWLAFLPMPIIIWGSLRFQRRLEPRYAEVRSQAGAINSALANNLGGIATIKSFTAEDAEVERISDESDRYRSVNAAAIRLSSAFSPLIRFAILTGFIATLVIGGFRTLDGALDAGLYATMVFLTQRLLWPLTRLGETLDLYQRAMASTNRVLNVLDRSPRILSGPEPLPFETVKGAIFLDAVDFAYTKGFPALVDATIEATPGETIALVGATGSGKTTVVKLLLRFYDVDSGSVTVDGKDVRDLEITDLRQAIGLVSQDVFLFHGTVAENISYGRPGADIDAIRNAAEIAEAHDFIVELPNGYDTIVGERGQKLSGGQRQRISIARAILKNPPILVLDEATSAVDNETEAAIQRSLARLAHTRTSVVVAHRLSTIRNADRIYVLDGGRVVESGTHDELVVRPGPYRALWDVQTGAAIVD